MGAALSISLLAGCGSDATDTGNGDATKQAVNEEGKQTTLTFIGHTSEDAKVEWEDQVIAGFEAEHEGVTIEVQRMSFDDYI